MTVKELRDKLNKLIDADESDLLVYFNDGCS
ncbi:MAG: hypothetical protein K0R54_2744 [Clostridiaceae bacterium]|jgi:hypothetical protein|nr:hypothetical protein [Clostridiaceae bacterium]MDF2950462.1 hypothetical protein [Anaerocolumna sp.]